MKRNILFIGLDYHSYTSKMILGMEELGYEVTYYSIKPRKLKHRILQTISGSLYNNFLNKYHKEIVSKEKENNYDYVFFLQVHFFTHTNFNVLKLNNNKAKFVLYNWDSLTTHDYSSYINGFDKVYTFDKKDAQKLNINYLPLFCIPDFQNLQQLNKNKNSIYFIGNIVSPDRYLAIQKFKNFCKKEKLNFHFYLKCSPVVFVRLLTNGYFPSDINFSNINHNKFIELLTNSTTVFDFANHKQVGFTMRFMENLCAGKKIITSNKNALNAKFYSADRILYIENLNFESVKEFVLNDLTNEDLFFSEYYLINFLKKILN
ncbi:hypothetical protein [Polaribacter vadi]|uniref:hypothetical protein n=1 Tax=Polaribacter vadi TaxID=1774273 RepID=UPI0030EE02A4|tara:strand:+ start:18680 stop:19633 length:954 start_codon:yes stop_codon:yes gene_type:complete